MGTSNIHESSLPFDLSLFKSLHHIEVNICFSPVRFLVNINFFFCFKATFACREMLGQFWTNNDEALRAGLKSPPGHL